MRRIILHGIVFMFFALSLLSCNLLYDLQSVSTKINFKAMPIDTSLQGDTLLLTGRMIKSYNDATGEVVFTDSLTFNHIQRYHKITCCIDSDSLFTFTLTTNSMSSIVNDLVLNHNLFDNKFYFEDGYPGYIDNVAANTIRQENKQKRAAAWKRFVEQLKIEGRVVPSAE